MTLPAMVSGPGTSARSLVALLPNTPGAQCLSLTPSPAFRDSRMTFVEWEHVMAELKVILRTQKKHV